MSWTTFMQSMEWREIEADVRERQRQILSDIVDPAKTKDLAELRGFQKEFITCEWFLALPTLFMQEKSNEKTDSNPS